MANKYITDIHQVKKLTKNDLQRIEPVVQKFGFRANEFYLSLINWDDPHDPIRRVIIPDEEELTPWGRLDASDEQNYTVYPGLQHKYTSTAVLLVSNTCGGFCRFCFRKRLFLFPEEEEYIRDLEQALDYLKQHKEVSNVLLTGGDGLMLSTPRLKKIIESLRQIDHIQVIRIGTKLLAYNPYRVLEDPELLELIKKFSTPQKRIYIMTHFNHPNEITTQSQQAAQLLLTSGAILANQTPMLKGVNDDPKILSDLFRKLSYIGIPPYYVFLCRPTVGNKGFAIPVEKALEIFQQAQTMGSGLAKRARLTMSHSTGKLEVVFQTEDKIYFRYHRSADPKHSGKVMIFKRNPNAYWLDDYEEKVAEQSCSKPMPRL
jgi:KamA family protein